MAVFFTRRGTPPTPPPPIGTTWLFEEDGTFEVPATGNYELELHGAGGHANVSSNGFNGYGGGGSGQIYEVKLTIGESYQISIGMAKNYSDGEATYFGSYSVQGGKVANNGGGQASGNIASSGQESIYGTTASGGLGNINKPEQLYGRGGDSAYALNSFYPQKGQNGAVIITYKGR